MKYCSNCGKQLHDEAAVCIGCGCAVKPLTQNSSIDPTDAPNPGFAVLGFFVPIVGLILYLVFHDTAPRKAKSAGKGALIGVIVNVVLTVIFSVLYVILMGALLGSTLYFS